MVSGTIAIIGVTGSFGNTVARAFLENEDVDLVGISRDEYKLHRLSMSLTTQEKNRLHLKLADVRDKGALMRALRGVDYVFHAAALKQVPSCEFFPLEAVKTNIEGAQNVLEVCLDLGIKKLICLSTDKAVYPVNAMGISKAMMEKCVLNPAYKDAGLPVAVTRYGNVFGSRGSVVPVWCQSIRSGGVITVTNLSMTRFSMSLQDSVQLVKNALLDNDSHSIYVPIQKSYTLEALLEAFKIVFASNLKFQIVGSRPGEKVHEIMATDEECAFATHCDSYIKFPSSCERSTQEEYFLGKATPRTDDSALIQLIRSDSADRLKPEELAELVEKYFRDYSENANLLL